jgi:hypothetical protein
MHRMSQRCRVDSWDLQGVPKVPLNQSCCFIYAIGKNSENAINLQKNNNASMIRPRCGSDATFYACSIKILISVFIYFCISNDIYITWNKVSGVSSDRKETAKASRHISTININLKCLIILSVNFLYHFFKIGCISM